MSGAYKHYWFGTYTEHMLWVVAMFFMISAFLLYRPFVAARINATDTSPSVADYAWRRFLRVVPGYWVALAVLWVTVGMPHMGQWWPHYFTLTQVYGSERQMLGGDSPGLDAQLRDHLLRRPAADRDRDAPLRVGEHAAPAPRERAGDRRPARAGGVVCSGSWSPTSPSAG